MMDELKNTFRDQVEHDLERTAKDTGEKTTAPAVHAIPLRVGDTIRANGYLYRVRKVVKKDIVLRVLGVETSPRVVVPRG